MKGMQKIKRGKGFRGLLEYSLENNRGEIIGGNMTGRNPRELAHEFGQSRSIREDIEKPVWHNSLRLPEGEKIDRDKWVNIADDYMRKMGFNDLHQRAYILHDDEAGQHIHIIASRIDLTGKIYLGQNENLKSTKYIAELEQQYNLTPTPQAKDSNNEKKRTFTTEEHGLEKRTVGKRTGEPPIREQLQTIIDQASADNPHFLAFVKRLHRADVSILPSGKTGTPQGITFELNGIKFKGSDLGKAYAWKQLNSRLDFNPERDQLIIDQLRQDPAKINAELTTRQLLDEPADQVTKTRPDLVNTFKILAAVEKQIEHGMTEKQVKAYMDTLKDGIAQKIDEGIYPELPSQTQPHKQDLKNDLKRTKQKSRDNDLEL